MMNWKKYWDADTPSNQRLLFLLLLIVGGIEFIFITMESLFSYIGYYLAEDYIIIPCLLFLGIALSQKQTLLAKRSLQLSAAAILWFVIVQIQHKLSGMGTHPIGTVFLVYLMAFPFAAVANDERNIGLKLIGKIFIAASLILIFYTILLFWDCVPAFLQPFVYWDGARLHVFWHSNISACFFMIGIGFSAAFGIQSEKRITKVWMLLLIVVQFAAMALTNCRTTLLMTSAFFGSVVFFRLNNGTWKRTIAGLLAAILLTVVSFKISSTIYQYHNDRLIAQIAAKLEYAQQSEVPLETVSEAASSVETAVDTISTTEGAEPASEATSSTEIPADTVPSTEAAEIFSETDAPTEPTQDNLPEHSISGDEIILISQNGQSTLSNDLKTLNGRTGIWKATLSAIMDNRSLALWGTEYPDLAISAYNSFPVVHAHNSWMEMLIRLGLPGLLIALVFTGSALYSAFVLLFAKHVSMDKKIIVMMTMCIMVAGFLEPYLFITNVYYHTMDFIFFFCVGYLNLWRVQLRNLKGNSN